MNKELFRVLEFSEQIYLNCSMIDRKVLIYKALENFVDQRIANIQMAIASANEAGKDETKSSAGDKHETGKAMAQLDQEQQGVQLAAALELKSQLNKINPGARSETIAMGSLIKTNKGWFYISIGAGVVTAEGFDCICISAVSPLGKVFWGKLAGAEIIFNGTKYKVEEVG